jgi:hypothetical protein
VVFAAAAGCRRSRERVGVEGEEVAGDRAAEVVAVAELGRGGAPALVRVQEVQEQEQQEPDSTLEQKACTG